MEHKLLVLCDPEEDYAQHMADFLCKRKEAVWEVMVFTKPDELLKMKKDMEILLIAESVYGAYVDNLPVKLPVLLNESGMVRGEAIANVDKYQEAEKVHRAVWDFYMEKEQDAVPVLRTAAKAKLIGMYSPVKRCLQTTFALTYGQLLAEKHRTLYLSFEYYGGRQEWVEGAENGMAKLLYFLPEEKAFDMRRRELTKAVGGLDYITPMTNGQNLLFIEAEDWRKLIKRLLDCGEYEYIILDLSESIQGLFELLRMCERIYTIVKEDGTARGKVLQYEQLLKEQQYEDVRGKTSKCVLPVFRKLPVGLEQYTKGELAEYVKEILFREVV